jgi:hypothetical protein
MIYGRGFHAQDPPGVSFDDEQFELKIIERQIRLFGMVPMKYQELVQGDNNIETILGYLYDIIPQNEQGMFSKVAEREVNRRDKEFICRIMKMDPRDRPTAEELLEDSWFHDGEELSSGS